MPITHIDDIPQRPHRVDEVVTHFGYSRRTVYRWVNQGILRAIKPRHGYGIRITYESIVTLWQSQHETE